MAKVLVTGATGFIGSKLTARLVADGHDVTCLVRDPRKSPKLESLEVRLVAGDVRDASAVRAAVAGTEFVYHLAAAVSAFRRREMIETNATAFRNVADACSRCASPPTLLFVSSLAAAGPSSPERPRVETDPPLPVSNYGRTKRAAELIAEEYASQVPITIVRPPIVYGEGDQNLRGLFRTIFRYGVHMALGLAYSRYSLIHVSDLVDALVISAERGSRLVTSGDESSKTPSGYYFVAGDEQPTFAELGTLIGTALGRARVFVCRSPSTISLWPAAAVAEVFARLRGRPHVFNFDKVREARAGSWTCSSQTIRREMGFAPGAPLSDRLRQTAEWYLQQKLL